MLSHMKVHEGNDNEPQDEMLNTTMRTKKEMFNSVIRPSNEYDAPMNLVVTEQPNVQQKIQSSWPNLDLHDGFSSSTYH